VDGLGYGRYGEYHADCAIGLINGPVSLNSGVIFRNACPVAETRRTIITRASVNFAQSISHGRNDSTRGLAPIDRRATSQQAASERKPPTLKRIHLVPSAELTTALRAAEAAAEVIRSLYQRNLAVQTKADKSPVTEADVRAEEVIGEILRTAFPDYGFYGEETGAHQMQAASIWLVDPIDGTKSFVRECPFFSTQIALMREGKIVLGVSSAPAYHELLWAERGVGAFQGDRRLKVSHVDALERSILSSGNLKSLARSPQWQAYGELVAGVDRIRGYGDFLHYHLLAQGALDLVIESDVNILDIAALSVIVEEAGGRVTDLEGRPISLDTRSVLASNSHLHDQVLSRL
jgi:histidinol-phosphatase